jgi:hypothetical protein
MLSQMSSRTYLTPCLAFAQALLTQHKAVVAQYLSDNYDEVWLTSLAAIM